MLARLPATVPSESVAADVEMVPNAPQVSRRITVSGHVYDTGTALLNTVIQPREPNAR